MLYYYTILLFLEERKKTYRTRKPVLGDEQFSRSASSSVQKCILRKSQKQEDNSTPLNDVLSEVLLEPSKFRRDAAPVGRQVGGRAGSFQLVRLQISRIVRVPPPRFEPVREPRWLRKRKSMSTAGGPERGGGGRGGGGGFRSTCSEVRSVSR